MQDSFGKYLGIVSFCGLVLILISVLAFFIDKPSGSQPSIFVLLTTLLNTIILYWPVYISGVMKQPAVRLAIALVAMGMVILNLFLSSGFLPRDFFIISTFQENAGVLYPAGLNLLALVFVITHYFLFKFFMSWLDSPVGHTLGISGFFVAAYVFTLYMPGQGLEYLFNDMVTRKIGDTPESIRLSLQLKFYLVMLYFFMVLIPYYLISIVIKNNFKVSPWMHMTYIFIGISGVTGLFLEFANYHA